MGGMGKAASEEVWLMAKVAVALTEECSGQTWDDEDRGEEITHLLEKAGYDVTKTTDRMHSGHEAVTALLDATNQLNEAGDPGGVMLSQEEVRKAHDLGRAYLEMIEQ